MRFRGSSLVAHHTTSSERLPTDTQAGGVIQVPTSREKERGGWEEERGGWEKERGGWEKERDLRLYIYNYTVRDTRDSQYHNLPFILSDTNENQITVGN